MYIPIIIENGVLKLPPGLKLPPEVRTATLVVNEDLHPNDDLDTLEFKLALLRDNPSLAFLDDEPDLYSLEDIKPENRNPNFISR
jgi:hypothetical protein